MHASSGYYNNTLKRDVLERAETMSGIPLLTDSPARLLPMSRQRPEDVDIVELEKLIRSDPALISRLLKVANSPYYTTKLPVTLVRQAIVIIGLPDVLSMLMVASLMDGLSANTDCKLLDPGEFLLHSIGVGAACRAAALCHTSAMLSPAEMRMAGMLHDIGRTVFLRYFPEELDECIDIAKTDEIPLLDAEIEVFGVGHDELGAMLAKAWNLPPFIEETIRLHHHVEPAGATYLDMLRVVRWADALVIEEKIGDSGNKVLPPVAEEPDPTVAALQARREQILQTTRDEMNCVSNAFLPAEEAPETEPDAPIVRAKTETKPKGIRRFFKNFVDRFR